MNSINNVLNTYSPILLAEMESVHLMDRTDTKFVFNFEQLEKILNELSTDYTILDVNGNRISRYESLYFDTKEFELYHHHHRGKSNRYKIRFRNYVESESCHFEIKLKNNKGRTIKNRVAQELINGLITGTAENLLKIKTHLNVNSLEAKFWVNYSRITLVNKNSVERVTIDINLQYKNDSQTKEIKNIVIAEVKQAKATNSKFIKTMKKFHIREGGISKYCYGVISLFQKIKHNNFKTQILLLNKLSYAPTTNT